MIGGHLVIGLVFGMISVAYSFFMGHGFLRMLIGYSVAGMVGVAMSATLTYVGAELRRAQPQNRVDRDTDRVKPAAESSMEPDRPIGQSTRDDLAEVQGAVVTAFDHSSSPVRMARRHRSRPVASERRFGPQGGERRLLVLFDVDGTLLDGAPMIVQCVTEAFRAAGETPPPPEAVRYVIGLSTDEMIGRLTRTLPVDRQAEILSSYQIGFFNAIERQKDLPLFPGVRAGLLRLRHAGVTLGIATGRSRRGVGHLLDTLGWRPLFRTVQHGDANPSKPDPTMIYRAMAEAGFKPEETVMIGDKCCDMRMARKAGIGVVGVSWGYDSPALLLGAGAQAIMEDFEHLERVMLALPAGRVEMRCPT
jgi:phosphoglycolate phosphatase